MTKQQRIAEYNKANPSYAITNIKKLSRDYIVNARLRDSKSLDECYQTYSDDKKSSYAKILRDYEPLEIISVVGSSFSYSVLLVAGNGDTLHITKNNNYLVEVV